MNPLSSELPFHVHNWLIISLKDFCIVIVIEKWPTFWPPSLKLQTEQFVMSQIDFGRELNQRIALHRKLLYASVPCLSVLTWEMTHDLPLRSEKSTFPCSEIIEF